MQALLDFDGKSTGVLERFAANHQPEPKLVADLCDFAAGEDQNVQAAATWLLKRFAVTGADLSPVQTEMLLRLLLEETTWLSRIHVLQMMDSFVLPSKLAAPLLESLIAQASGDNTFVRAWSCHGAAVLADQHPACRERVRELLAAAEQDAAPSVRARLRKTIQMINWR